MLLLTFIGLLSLISECFMGWNDECIGKPDGNYLIRNVFEYLSCISQSPLHTVCFDGDIYDPKYGQCRNGVEYNFNNFCLGKPDDDYINPWNCHSFISCSNGVSYNMSCPEPELFYNPESDSCEFSSQCRILVNPCVGKADGKYWTYNVLAYLQCSSQQGSHVNCPDNQIFDPIYNNCRDARDYNLRNLCIGRHIPGRRNKYSNPWNCHSYFTCDSFLQEVACLKREFVYDPYDDYCEDPSIFPCRTVKIGNPCAGKVDGKYLIPNAFAFLQCLSQQGSYVHCANNQIFDPNYNNCMDAKDYNLENFCFNKPDGYYRNPWKCGSYISCFSQENLRKSNVKFCHSNEVYNPYIDYCEDSSFFPCRTVNINNPCKQACKNCLIPDVFAFLNCSSEQGSYENCPDNQIFDPNYNQCMDAQYYNLENFCIGRPDGQYRNPWNCHSYISCFSQDSLRKSKILHCFDPEYVYNPYDDFCENSSFFPCRTVNMETSTAKDIFVEIVAV